MWPTRAWYAAGWSHELKQKPMRRQVLGEQLALFRDAAGTAHVVGAVCPHRGMDLGCGHVVNGNLQCPWHGWEYDGEGKCVRIPAQHETVPIPARARLPVFPLREQQGFLWVWMDREVGPVQPPRRYDFFDLADAQRKQWAAACTAGGWMNTVENTMNTAHLAFVHTKSMGVKLNPLVGAFTIEFDDDGTGFRAWEPPPTRPGEYNSQKDFITSGPTRWLAPILGIKPVAHRRSAFYIGGFSYVMITYVDGSREWILAAITPCSETHTWFFFETVRTRGRHVIADWFQRRFMRLLLQEDVDIVAKTLANGPAGLPNPVSVQSDARMLAVRRLYARALRAEGKPVPWAAGAGPAMEAEGIQAAAMPVASAVR